MNSFKNTRLIIPVLVFATGIFYLLNPETEPGMRRFWWFLTPFALAVGILRIVMLKKQKKSVEADENLQ